MRIGIRIRMCVINVNSRERKWLGRLGSRKDEILGRVVVIIFVEIGEVLAHSRCKTGPGSLSCRGRCGGRSGGIKV